MLKSLLRFATVARAEKQVFVLSLIGMVAARLALFVWPVHKIVRAANGLNRRWPRKGGAPVSVRAAAKRILQAIRFAPVHTTCLSESIAAQFVMARLGFRTELRIGVSRENARFAAHAWLDCPEGIVIGNPSPEGKTYNTLPSLERFFA